jgi:acyl-coenzyme A thioesterase PaaI-like protein
MIVSLLRYVAERTPTFVMRFLFNAYPPYFGAGIKVEEISKDRRYLRVKLKLSFWNRNYVGTQFGGSIYSMTDPHFMYLLINNLGPGYIVWDSGAKIEFIKPGKTHLVSEFKIDDQILNTVKEQTKDGQKYIFDLPAEVFDLNGVLVARVTKSIYVRKKPAQRS